jgi:hypothetical protein
MFGFPRHITDAWSDVSVLDSIDYRFSFCHAAGVYYRVASDSKKKNFTADERFRFWLSLYYATT